ncbi:MAG: hypothetical protein ACF8XB_20165 [Planctomycetota bacterium JB042]
MPTAVADVALAELVCALEDVRPDSLRSSLRSLRTDRVFARYLAESCLLRDGRGPGRRAETLRRVLRADPDERAELDRFVLDSAALAALRARRVFLGRELRHRARRADPTRPFRAASIGLGDHGPLLDLLSGPAAAPALLEATVVDVDEDGVTDALERARGSRTSAAVKGTVRDPRALDAELAVRSQDVVVLAAHLDFVATDEAEEVIGRAYDRLAPGGELLTGHWHDDLTPRDRLVLEGLLGWAPVFRRPRALARLVQTFARERGATVAGCLRGPNIFFVIQRPV